MPHDPVTFFKALADNSRLRILATLMDAPKYVEVIAERLNLTPSTVSFHLKKLEEVGLVDKVKEQYYIVYSVNTTLLEKTPKAWLEMETLKEDQLEDEREQAYRKKVLDAFFEYDRLVAIPVQRKKKRIILEKLLDAFGADLDYTELEVNTILGQYHEDVATLRRAMIEEKLMTRSGGIYRII